MSSAAISSSWSIAIKTVGSGLKANRNIMNRHDNNENAVGGGSSENDTSSPPQLLSSSSGESHSFTLQVHPNDPLYSLSAKIESITGLSPSEQRLIYRGRIISVPPPNHNDAHAYSTIQDINGLSDGETIHLVPRVISTVGATPSNSAISSTNAPDASPRRTNGTINHDNEADGIANALMRGLLAGFNTNYPTEDTVTSGLLTGGSTGANVSSLSGSDGMNLLAALLGLGSAVDSSGGARRPSNDSNNNRNQQQRRQGGGMSGNGQGLGGVASRADMMSVLGDGGSNNSNTATTTAAAVPLSSLDGLVAEAVRSAATRSVGGTGGGAGTTPTSQPRPTPTSGGLFDRSADEIRSSRNAATAPATATANLFNPNNNSTNNVHSHTTASSSATRAARNRRRATAARLTASDIRVPDPGSMEPVRQGLMTLHTLLGNAELGLNEQRRQQQPQEVDGEKRGGEEEDLAENFEEQSPQSYHDYHPLNSHRQWYRGQWLDALDTVNQWLEATIVDIVLPSDLLGNYALSRSCNGMRHRRSMYNNISQQPVEAVVSGNDLEGRRRLLLEPRPISEEDDDNNMMGVYDLLNEGYRPRDDNDGIQLLLIHYNGWPHRWDEWIRSDSPRIRPFRTRTRHRAMSTRASPTPQSVFQAAPPTFIRDESNEVERAMLLPELQRVISSVNDVLSCVIPLEEGEGRGMISSPLLQNDSPSTVDSSHLPWRLPNHGSEYFQSAAADNDDGGNSVYGYSNDSVSASTSSLRPGLDPRDQLNAAQLRQLAPLIDRLGRTLTDSAPHIASLADALPSPSPLPQAGSMPRRQQQVGYGSESFASQASRLYFGINSDNDGRSESTSSNPTADDQVMEVDTAVDPDLTDFVNGMVNTTRGVSSRDTNREPISSSLLASYLSSIGAGINNINNDAPRIVRVGGGDGAFGAGNGGVSGPGIDIHIHAIVTGPGMTPTGLDGLGIGGGASVNRNVNVSAPITDTPEQQQSSGGGIDGDEIDHLFSDLYSESPPPVNLHHNQRHYDNGNNENLSQIFEECRSIEDESDSSIDSAATQPFDGKIVASADEDVGPTLEEGATLANSELVNESDYTSNDTTTIETASSPDANLAPSAADRQRSSTSFGRRMYRRTFGRLSGSSRR